MIGNCKKNKWCCFCEHWYDPACSSLEKQERLEAKVRYGKNTFKCSAIQTNANELTVTFDETVRAPAPGQSLVLYDGDIVVGGGIIK